MKNWIKIYTLHFVVKYLFRISPVKLSNIYSFNFIYKIIQNFTSKNENSFDP